MHLPWGLIGWIRVNITPVFCLMCMVCRHKGMTSWFQNSFYKHEKKKKTLYMACLRLISSQFKSVFPRWHALIFLTFNWKFLLNLEKLSLEMYSLISTFKTPITILRCLTCMPFIVILVFYSRRKERSKMMLPAFFFSTFLYKVDDKVVVSTTNIWIPLLEWWRYWLWWWFCNVKWFLCTSLFYISHKNQNHQQELFYKWDNWGTRRLRYA